MLHELIPKEMEIMQAANNAAEGLLREHCESSHDPEMNTLSQ